MEKVASFVVIKEALDLIGKALYYLLMIYNALVIVHCLHCKKPELRYSGYHIHFSSPRSGVLIWGVS